MTIMWMLFLPAALLVGPVAGARRRIVQKDEHTPRRHNHDYPVELPSGIAHIRRVITDGPTYENFYHFGLDEQPSGTKIDLQYTNGVEHPPTHVILPRDKPLQAGFARTSHNQGGEMIQREQGLANFVVIPNRRSIVTDRALFGLGEKSHVMEHSGPWDTQSMAARRLAARGRGDPGAHSQRHTRDHQVAIATGVANLGPRLIEAAVDTGHLAQVRAHAKFENSKARFRRSQSTPGVAETLESTNLAEHRERARSGLDQSRRGVVSKSSANLCTHYEINGRNLELTQSGVRAKLGRKFVVLRGQVSFAPSQYFKLMVGTAFWHYDATANAIEMFIQFTAHMHVHWDMNLPTTLPTRLYLGPADGKSAATTGSPVPKKDGRSHEHLATGTVHHHMIKSAFCALSSQSMDYTRFDKDPAELCPQSDIDTLGKHVQDALQGLEGEQAENLWELFKDPKEALAKSFGTISATVETVDCASVYLRSDLAGANGFGVLEMTVWGHFILEANIEDKDLAFLRFWDDGIRRGEVSSVETTPEHKVELNEQKCSFIHRMAGKVKGGFMRAVGASFFGDD